MACLEVGCSGRSCDGRQALRLGSLPRSLLQLILQRMKRWNLSGAGHETIVHHGHTLACGHTVFAVHVVQVTFCCMLGLPGHPEYTLLLLSLYGTHPSLHAGLQHARLTQGQTLRGTGHSHAHFKRMITQARDVRTCMRRSLRRSLARSSSAKGASASGGSDVDRSTSASWNAPAGSGTRSHPLQASAHCCMHRPEHVPQASSGRSPKCSEAL